MRCRSHHGTAATCFALSFLGFLIGRAATSLILLGGAAKVPFFVSELQYHFVSMIRESHFVLKILLCRARAHADHT